MEAQELLKHANEFIFYPKGADGNSINAIDHCIKVSQRSPGRWAVIHSFQCWNGKEWVYENRPSERTKSFLKKTRFSMEKAVKIALEQVDHAKVNGRTYAEWQELFIKMEEHERIVQKQKEQQEKDVASKVEKTEK